MSDSNPSPDLKLNDWTAELGRNVAWLGAVALLMLMPVGAEAESEISAGWARMPEIVAPMAASAPSIPARDWAPEEILLVAPHSAATSVALSTQSDASPQRIGFSRPVPILDNSERFAVGQVWHRTASGGRASAFKVTSPQARALRLGLRIVAIPDAAVVRFYDPEGQIVHSVSGGDIKATIQRNLAAGDTGEDAETYWSPVIEGESQIMDIELPPGTDPSELRMSVPRLSHLLQSPLAANLLQPMAAAYCHNDVMCYPAWRPESNATARMVYTSNGATYLCTGTLLNDKDDTTFIPYFLSANHCIPTQSVASTLQTNWFYRSAACGGGVGSVQTRTGGATLLYTAEKTDTSFMRLLADPPPGAVLAGWSASLPAVNEYLIGLHHPAGDLQKISFGNLWDYGNCVWIDSQRYCSLTDPASADGFVVGWSDGTTEPGSSGSGIFNTNHQLVGNLWVGPIDYACGSADNWGGYGRFDIPFYARLYQWLNYSPSFPPETGWWWNPQESGRGFTIEMRDGKLFMAVFLYDPSGRPTWFTSGGAMNSGTSYVGQLVSFANGQTLTGPYKPPVQTSSVGWVSLEFHAADRATLTWPGGTLPIERFKFGEGPRSTGVKPEAGWWWNVAESGRGFAIETQGDTLFIAGYMYDASGNPVWFTANGQMDATNHFNSTWVQFSGGQTLTGPYVPPVVTNPNVGSVIVHFLSPTSALVTLPNGRQISLSRFAF